MADLTSDLKSDLAPPDAARAYRLWLPRAQALAETAVVLPYRLDADLAIVNVNTGMKVVHDHLERIPVELPRVDVPRLLALPDLALAVKLSALLAEQAAPSEKLVSERLAEARRLRSILMPAVKSMVAAGLISDKTYKAIARGRGPRDAAGDCVSLGRLIVDGGDQLAGKHPVTPDDVQSAIEHGSWLLQVLKSDKTPKDKAPAPVVPEVDIRNRLATLLIQGHEKLQLVSFNFHGSSYAQHAPALNSRRAPAKKKDETAPNSPAAGQPATKGTEPAGQ